MACSNCGTHENGLPKGCKNNGSCGTGGCNKLTVFDWLANMQLPSGSDSFPIVEVSFKNGRKDFFRNTDQLPLQINDVVATEAASGHDVGVVTLTGELVGIQMRKKKVSPEADLLKIYRKASQHDIDVWQKSRAREEEIQKKSREIAIRLGLQMKISDIEMQGDGSKAIFYYTAESRVDFRQLIKEYARVFSIRIEMKQVGLRQEASRLGGIGSCGRELCCSTFLTDYRSVNTLAAKYQQLSLNPQKLAGQCGKLKCCLNYELDAYLDALQDFPDTEYRIETQKGTAICQKIDIFKGILWYAYEGEWMNWHMLSVEKANELIRNIKEGKKVEGLEAFVLSHSAEQLPDFENVVGQDSLNRFDRPRKRRNQNKGKKNRRNARN